MKNIVIVELGNSFLQKVKEFSLLTKSKGLELSIPIRRLGNFEKDKDFRIDDEFRYYFINYEFKFTHDNTN
jgi:hypothetical protein